MDAPASGTWQLAAAGLFGWVWGSFLNTVVDRTPRRDGTGRELGWFTPPRSLCIACGTSIPWYDNLPVLSYVALRGHCRSCGVAIGLRTLVVEVATLLGFIGLAAVIHPARQGIGYAWGAAVLSAVLVTVPVLLEARRPHRIAIAWMLLALTGVLLWRS